MNLRGVSVWRALMGVRITTEKITSKKNRNSLFISA
jgi:hypothetical protein